MKTLLAQAAIGTFPIAVIVVLAVCFAVAWLIAWTRGRTIGFLRRLVPPPRPDGGFGWLPPSWPDTVELVQLSTDKLGEIVREAWTSWASRQPDAKESWLTPWRDLPDDMKDADRIIGISVAHYTLSALYTMTEKHRQAAIAEVVKLEQSGSVHGWEYFGNYKRGELAGLEASVAMFVYISMKIERFAADMGKKASEK